MQTGLGKPSPIDSVYSAPFDWDSSSVLLIGNNDSLNEYCTLNTLDKEAWHRLLSGDVKVSDSRIQKTIEILGREGALKTALTLIPDSIVIGSIFGDALVRSFSELPIREGDDKAEHAFRCLDKFSCHGQLKGELPGGSLTFRELQRGVLKSLRAEKLSEMFIEESRKLGLDLKPLDAPKDALPFLPRTYVASSPLETQFAAALLATQFVRYHPAMGYYLGGTGETQKQICDFMKFLKDKYEGTDFPADYSRLALGHIDQYLDCPDDSTESFVRYITERLENPLGFDSDKTDYIHGRDPSGDRWEASALEQELFHLRRRQVARALSGVPGLVQMGVGPSDDPHIAFCPRGAPFMDRINVYNLDSATIARDVARGQTEYNLAISYGARGILTVSNQFITAVGADKGASLAGGFTPVVNEQEQLSAMLLGGRRTFLFIDKQAADVLEPSLATYDWSQGLGAA